MKTLFPGLFVCMIAGLLLIFDARSMLDEFATSSGFAIGLMLVCIYGACFLLYRIVSKYNEYRVNIDYQ